VAGTDSSFDAADFRANIRATMNMGLSNVTADQPLFIFNASSTSYPAGTALDEAGQPFDFTVTPTVTQKNAVRVPCAVTWGSGLDSIISTQAGGDFTRADAVLTMLDVDYTLVKDADYCQINNTKYEIRYIQPAVGLFDVTVYQLHLFTWNQK
jgi:hypothetical protein